MPDASCRWAITSVRCGALVTLHVVLALGITTGLFLLNSWVNEWGDPNPGAGFLLLGLWSLGAVIGVVAGMASALAAWRGRRTQLRLLAGAAGAALLPPSLLFFVTQNDSSSRTLLSCASGVLVLAGAVCLAWLASDGGSIRTAAEQGIGADERRHG
jgi:hypothetical protein